MALQASAFQKVSCSDHILAKVKAPWGYFYDFFGTSRPLTFDQWWEAAVRRRMGLSTYGVVDGLDAAPVRFYVT